MARIEQRLAAGKVALVALLAAGSLAAARRAAGHDRERIHQAAYLADAPSRRSALIASLVNPDNAYGRLRRAHYATGAAGDWDRLRAWNPRVAAVTAPEREPRGGTRSRPELSALPIGAETRLPPAADLHALGEAAFFRYPAQLAPALPDSLSAAAAARYGLWVDSAGRLGGLVRAEMADGSTRIAFSCATCHADVVAGRLVAGLPSARLDVGRMIADAGPGAPSAWRRNVLAWGPGRVDVTTEDGSVPERIADLRPVRWLDHLQYDATVRQTDVVDLAIRVETLIVTAHGQALRPPRVVSLALAQFIRDLASELPPPPAADAPGAPLFARRCASCHGGPGLSGAPQPLEAVGTDPALGDSADRGTGTYRVPSLRGVASRPSLLHDGALSGLDALLDPARLDAGYGGGARGPGAVRGHAFGLDLPIDERRALISYLRRL
jgi:hypothetical protein